MSIIITQSESDVLRRYVAATCRLSNIGELGTDLVHNIKKQGHGSPAFTKGTSGVCSSGMRPECFGKVAVPSEMPVVMSAGRGCCDRVFSGKIDESTLP